MPKAETRIYLDFSSTTNIHPEVLKTYIQLLDHSYVNSESLYDEGAEVSRMLEKARAATAGLLGVNSSEIIYTSGSSEANSLAIKGVPFACKGKKHIITSQIEHSSIINACRQMERLFGYRVTYLPVNEKGVVSSVDLKKNLTEDTALVSIMHVNNETGAINPIDELKEIVKKQSHAYFHSDLTQSIGKIPVDLKMIDLASISAHKMEGLKGSGVLVKKTHVPLEPLINGGEQEFGFRGGTNNAPSNIVFAKTLRLALENMNRYRPAVKKLHDYLWDELSKINGILLNSSKDGIESVINFSYEAIPSEVMQNALNNAGFMISARSTCEAHSNNPSYVLQAMGYSDRRASSCIRVSLSHVTTKDEIDSFIFKLKEIIEHYG